MVALIGRVTHKRALKANVLWRREFLRQESGSRRRRALGARSRHREFWSRREPPQGKKHAGTSGNL
jgi:hypothetical protein